MEKDVTQLKNFSRIVCLGLLAWLLGACAASGKSPAAAAVEDYLAALVNKNADQLTALSCAAWESQALLELDSFEAVTPELEGLACEETGTDGDRTLVVCSGKINVTYNDEKSALDLSRWTYEVIQQGGDWLVCGVR